MNDWFVQHDLKQNNKIHTKLQYESYCYQLAFDIFKEGRV
jgi:hypothetical protein